MDMEEVSSTFQQESGGMVTSEQPTDGYGDFPSSSIDLARPPPNDLDGFGEEEVGSTQTLDTVDTPSLSQNEAQDIKMQLEYSSKVLHRHIQEFKNSNELGHQRFETMNKELAKLNRSVTKMESKLGPLQKMVANQTDRSLSLKKDMNDSESTLKILIAEVRQQLTENLKDLSSVKSSLNELTLKVNSNSQRAAGGLGQGNLPDNVMQMLEPFERQLGMYDLRIAELDSRFQVVETTSFTGTLVWKIGNYSRRKSEAIAGKTLSLYSQPFYTSRYGYKMCGRIYLNGDGMGKGTHMSLFFVVMKGEYDALLPWPFRQKVTLMLLDQGPDRRHLSDTFRPDPTSSSFKLPTSDMNIASGCPLFVAHNVINGSSYIKEDTIFLRMVIDTSDLDNL